MRADCLYLAAKSCRLHIKYLNTSRTNFFILKDTGFSLPAPTGGGGGYFEPPSRFLTISSKPMQVSPPNLQYPLSQHFYTLC